MVIKDKHNTNKYKSLKKVQVKSLKSKKKIFDLSTEIKC